MQSLFHLVKPPIQTARECLCVYKSYRTDVTVISPLAQYVFKTESFTASTTRTVHEELAKAMTAILKPSTDFLTSNKLLKVTCAFFSHSTMCFHKTTGLNVDFFLVSEMQYSWYFFEALVKSMAQYLIESGKVRVSASQRLINRSSSPLCVFSIAAVSSSDG